MNTTDPTVLWRLERGDATAHATLLPGSGVYTLTWFINGVMDRIENYDSMELALARADYILAILTKDGWTQL